jgi:hypothetical protein
VADLLAASGDSLGILADFCLDGNSSVPCPNTGAEVHRIRVCDALRSLCPPGVEHCPSAEPFDCIFGETAVELPEVEDYLEITPRGLVCEFAEFSDPGLPCPHWRLPDRVGRQWTDPQPGSDPCPNCGLKAAKVYIQLDPGFLGELGNATLTLDQHSYSIGMPQPGKLYVLDLQPLGYQPGGTQVTLSFSLNGKNSVNSELFTYPL